MGMHKGLIGKSDGGASTTQDKTLGDYIRRKSVHDAFERVREEKKLTFDEWYLQSGWASKHQRLLSLDDADAARYIMSVSWAAAQENK